MEEEKKQTDILDRLIIEALEQQPDDAMPSGFALRVVSRWERKVVLRELLIEFGIKTALVVGSLAVLAGFLFIPAKETLFSFLRLAADHWQIITGTSIIILVTFFIDQVLLRFFSESRQEFSP
jgi:hypothetical protein